MQYTLNTTSDNQITTLNIHTVQGPQGRDGHDGIPGHDGRDGAPGRQGKKGNYSLQGPTGPQCMHFKFDLDIIVTIMSTDITRTMTIVCGCSFYPIVRQETKSHTHTYTHTQVLQVLLMVVWLIRGRAEKPHVPALLEHRATNENNTAFQSCSYTYFVFVEFVPHGLTALLHVTLKLIDWLIVFLQLATFALHHTHSTMFR